MAFFFGKSKKKQPPTKTHFSVEGLIECRSCGTEQPYTNHVCMECGQDPWATPSEGWQVPGTVPLPGSPDSDLLEEIPVVGITMPTELLEAEASTAQSQTTPGSAAEEGSAARTAVSTGGASPASSVAQTATPRVPAVSAGTGSDSPNAKALTDMGIPLEHAVFALAKFKNDFEQALNFCLENDVSTLLGAEQSATEQHSLTKGLLLEEASDGVLADEHAECPICFEVLHAAPISVFTKRDGKRVCQHFYHTACAQAVLSSGQNSCPLCRRETVGLLEIPNVEEDSSAWFAACDIDGSGTLSSREVFEILKAQFPINHAELEKELPRLWERWDPSRDGYIQQEEFLGPSGLLSFIKQNFAQATRGPIPDIRSNKEGWFDYVDEDLSGELSVNEVTRGLIKALRLSSDLEQVQQTRSIVSNIWCVFDADGSGGISRAEFLRANDGMGDSIVASLRHEG